jgi:hypothetical protein
MTKEIQLNTAQKVANFFSELTPQDRVNLEIRENFSVRGIFDVNRNGMQGSFVLKNIYEFPEGDKYIEVARQEEIIIDIPTTLINNILTASLANPEVNQKVIDYFGRLPNLLLIGN